MTTEHSFRWYLGAIRQQVMTCLNDDLWFIPRVVALGIHELIIHGKILLVSHSKSLSTDMLTKTGIWWRHQMETFSALLVLCLGNSSVTGEFSSQRALTRSFGVLFDLRLSKRLSKQPRRQEFETPTCSVWRHCNAHVFGLIHWLLLPWLLVSPGLR